MTLLLLLALALPTTSPANGMEGTDLELAGRAETAFRAGVALRDQGQHGIEDFFAVVFPNDGSNPFTGHRANARAGFLDSRKEWQENYRDPQLAVAKLGAGLGVGGNAGGVIVRGAGNDAGAGDFQNFSGFCPEFGHYLFL